MYFDIYVNNDESQQTLLPNFTLSVCLFTWLYVITFDLKYSYPQPYLARIIYIYIYYVIVIIPILLQQAIGTIMQQ